MIREKESADMLKSLTRNAYRLQDLITDILDVARIEAGTFIIDRDKVNLTNLITTAIADAENQVKVSGKKIEISYSDKQMQQAQENKDLKCTCRQRQDIASSLKSFG